MNLKKRHYEELAEALEAGTTKESVSLEQKIATHFMLAMTTNFKHKGNE